MATLQQVPPVAPALPTPRVTATRLLGDVPLDDLDIRLFERLDEHSGKLLEALCRPALVTGVIDSARSGAGYPDRQEQLA